MENAAVVDGVYVVARPITPTFMPLAKANIWDEACFGRKLL